MTYGAAGRETRRAKREGKPSRYALNLLSAILGAAALAAGGCAPASQRAAPEQTLVRGPQEVLAAHNAWADSIRHVWARADLMLDFPLGEGKRERHDVTGHLFLEKPSNLFVHGEVLGQDVFTLGASAERFWLWIKPNVNTVWTGQRGGPGEARLIISPSALAEALGVFRIDLEPDARADFVAYPEHYVLSVGRAVGGKRVLVRRIWFDSVSLRPMRVDLFDATGRRTLRAELLKYERVGAAEVCTVYRARFYGDEEVDLVLRLKGVRLDKKPNPRVFEYRPPPGAAEKDLDQPPETP
ncbi:MAG TPA: hypothetical protein VFH53_04415 [Phycisphaerae bacterium]|nr:hypothetical protein [Phycisphaerae bacterium]